jgi:hypothetical protein
MLASLMEIRSPSFALASPETEVGGREGALSPQLALRAVGRFGQRMALGALDREPVGVEQVAVGGIEADRDPLVHPGLDLAVGLDDDHVAARHLGGGRSRRRAARPP